MPQGLTNGGFYSRSINRFAGKNVNTTPYTITVGTAPGYSDGDTVINYIGTSAGVINLPSKTSLANYFSSITLTVSAATIGNFVIIKNNSSSNLTIQTTDGSTVEGGSSYIIRAGDSAQLFFDGNNNWFVDALC